MASTKNAVLIFMFLVMIMSQKSNGETYKVGDSAGWTDSGHVDYKTWAAIKTFHVGDNIRFEYNKEYHNVVRVTHKNFNSCNTTAPYATMDTGHDLFTIKRPGHFYFICGVPGHCDAGQRVDIRVLPAPQPTLSPRSPSTYGPAPSPSSSESFSSTSHFRLSIFVSLSVAYGIKLL